jgi:hypothetical protein
VVVLSYFVNKYSKEKPSEVTRHVYASVGDYKAFNIGITQEEKKNPKWTNSAK